MGLFGIYTLFTGTKTDFLKNFKDSDTMYSQAKTFWAALENGALFYLMILLLGILLCWVYYGPFNNLPERHYKPRYWWFFALANLFLTLLTTYFVVHSLVPPRVQGANLIEWRLALGNAVYSSIIYCGVSIIWCKWLPTNAYRYLKF
jgi:hypothetical protein